ncbi:hypothetical protein MHL86_11760 [Brevibacillus laterosporus]|nr:hypothetical protein [Brevibacillus laterosporus]
MDKAIETKVNQEKPQVIGQEAEPTNLNLYVEGKTDEDFFNVLTEEYGLAERLKVEKLNVISLGGAFFSEKLIKILSDLGEKNLFLFENDELIYPGSRGIKKYVEEKFPQLPVIYLEPSIMQFIRINDLIQDGDIALSLEKTIGESISLEHIHSDPRLLNEIEKYLRTKYRNRLKPIFSRFIDEERVAIFIEQVNQKLYGKS